MPEFLDLNVCARCADYLLGRRWKHYDAEEDAVRPRLPITYSFGRTP